MIQPPVRQSFVCLIIPFAYGMPFGECKHIVDPERFEIKEIKADRLFDYAEHLVSTDPERHEAIGARWIMRQSARKTFGLPHNFHHPLVLRVKQKQWTFAIRDIELYLFETQTGFLQYHVEFQGDMTMEEQIEAVYYLKKLKNYSHEISFEQRISKETAITQDVLLSDMSCSILREFNVATFFEGSADHPIEALVYSSARLGMLKEESEDAIGEYLFHMRRNFKSSYKASAAERDVNGNPDVLALFDNSCWGISLEGLGNIVTMTEDEVTNQFFSAEYFHHIEHTYLYLYILALHQKYALLHLSSQASKLSHELNQNRDDPSEQSRILRRMKDRIVQFMLRSSYKHVSRSTHHAMYYEWIRNRLAIDDLFSELHDALEALVSLTDTAEQRQRQEQEDRKKTETERFNKKITGISAIFLPLSVITGIYGMDVDWLAPIKELWIVSLLAAGAYGLTFVLFKYWFNKD